MIRVSVIGANGYTGAELLNIFRHHPKVSVESLVSKSNSGKKVTELYPGMIAYRDKVYQEVNIEKIAKQSDVVFTALPHGKSTEIVSELRNAGVKVIDLSADFRYDNVEKYQEIYKVEHSAKDLKGVYGMPEINREEIKGKSLVANPGCYTTCSILPLYPLVKEGLIDINDIIINAASGVSGAGRKVDLGSSYCETNENYKAYAVTTHRHTSEIEEKLSQAAGKDIILEFVPHLLPIQRGILSTIYTKLEQGVSEKMIEEIYNEYYHKEEFVIVDKDALPSINQIKYSNYCKIGYKYDKRVGRLILVSALDNLVKGASGQAVQNMNIIMGIEENTGLTAQPYHI